MHVHPNQINANTQMDALYAADKAAAKREVERTRRKLMEWASTVRKVRDGHELPFLRT